MILLTYHYLFYDFVDLSNWLCFLNVIFNYTLSRLVISTLLLCFLLNYYVFTKLLCFLNYFYIRQVLKKLYHKNHIVIGNELLKLASLKFCLDDRKSAIHDIKQLEAILSLYYGTHITKIFPYLDDLMRQIYS